MDSSHPIGTVDVEVAGGRWLSAGEVEPMNREANMGRRGAGLRTAVAGLVGLAWVTTATAPNAVAAQSTVSLGEPEAAHAEGFGLIAGIRELPDGRVLLADPMSQLFVTLSPDLSDASPLGQEGQGPGEFRQPDGIWPIGGDRSLLVDLGNARLTQVDANGSLGESWPMLLPGGGFTAAIPGGTDASGNVYFQGSVMGRGGVRDSVEVFRLDLDSGEREAAAMVKASGFDRRESGSAGEMNVQIVPIPLSPADSWGTTSDGGLYVARADGYVVEFVTPDGQRRVGSPVDYEPVSIGRAERDEWQERREREGAVGMSVEEVNGSRTVSLARRRGSGASDLAWPESKPPFEAGAILVDGAGRGWVRRSRPAGEEALYDVFNQQGDHVASVELPATRVLVGFGGSSLYAARVDEVDLHYLERYSMPRMP